MARGRPPKPTALKLLQGNPGKRALPKGEPKPKAVESLPCPEWMPGEAREYWLSLEPVLARMGVLTEADRSALILLCMAWSQWREASAIVAAEGMTCVGSHGGIVTRPEVQIAANAERRVSAMLGRFGLTPSDRSKVQTTGADQERDPMDELLAERGA